MKLSEWIAQLQDDVDCYGDQELNAMPSGWLSDVVPDEIADWLLRNGWVVITLLPEGVLVPGLLTSDLDDDECELGERLEDAVLTHASDETDRAQIVAALRRALAALGEK